MATNKTKNIIQKILLKSKFYLFQYDEIYWALYKEIKGGWKMLISGLRLLKWIS